VNTVVGRSDPATAFANVVAASKIATIPMPELIPTVVLYNPQAGRMRRWSHRLLRDIVTDLAAQGMDAQLAPTPAANAAGPLVQKLVDDDRVKRILIAGGDGTINEVINAIEGMDVEVGILPAGTANVLANELGIGDWRRAVAAVGSWVPRRIALGVIAAPERKERRFLMMAGAGLDARLVYNVNPEFKRHVGKLAYWFAGFSQLTRSLEQLRVVADGKELLGSFCLASRVQNYGGDLHIAPSIRLLDEDLEVVCFEGAVAASYLPHLAAVLTGRVTGADGISVFRARALELAPAGSEPVHVQVDGEYAGLLPARIHVQPNAMTLLVPPAYVINSRKEAA